MTLKWEAVLPAQKVELATVLNRYGAEAVNLGHLLHYAPWGEWRDALGVRFWAWKVEGEPLAEARAIVAIKGRYLVLPYWIHPPTPEALDSLSLLLEKRTEAYLSVMGTREMTASTEKALLFALAHQRVLYDFMVRTPGPFAESFSVDGVECSRVSGLNALEVYPLQEAYEKEEVLFSPDEYQPVASRWNFQKSLKREVVYVARHRGVPIAKGGTNARSDRWAQIGGVYTALQWRGKGVQTFLMQALIRRLTDEGVGACLFVKKTNEAAKRLYRKLGFETVRDFEISYWQREL